jgi:hypothetical protein
VSVTRGHRNAAACCERQPPTHAQLWTIQRVPNVLGITGARYLTSLWRLRRPPDALVRKARGERQGSARGSRVRR